MRRCLGVLEANVGRIAARKAFDEILFPARAIAAGSGIASSSKGLLTITLYEPAAKHADVHFSLVRPFGLRDM